MLLPSRAVTCCMPIARALLPKHVVVIAHKTLKVQEEASTQVRVIVPAPSKDAAAQTKNEKAMRH